MNNGDEVEILKGQFKGVIGKIINDDMFICSCCGQKPLSAQIEINSETQIFVWNRYLDIKKLINETE